MTSINFFINESSLKDHIKTQNSHYSEYISNLLLLFYEYNIDFTILKLSKILVASLIRNDKELAKFLLQDPRYELPVILKSCDILDSNRLYKQLNKKTEKIQNASKLSKHKSFLSNLQALNEGIEMSLTKSKIKFIKKNWINNIDKNRLEYSALLYPVKHWKFLIDLFHLKPNDFQLEWFTTYIFTNEYPKESIIDVCNSLTSENIKEMLCVYKLPYDFLRLKYKDLLDEHVMSTILDYTQLNNIIRHWSNFNTQKNTLSVINRINNGEIINIPYGELMKRIQMLTEGNESPLLVEKLIDDAENKLIKYKIDIEQPVVVLGDASASMDIAVKTSSIITSILVKICNAKMHLFRDHDEPIENPPTNVKEVLETIKKFKANSCTAPAASLYPYYQRKEIVKTFILVTDEVENSNYQGIYTSNTEGFFASVFKKYREEVYPAKLVFISFLENNKDGQMVNHLKQLIPGIEKDIIQFIMNNKNPDLRKLDELLNTLSLDTNFYNIKYEKVKNYVNNTDKTLLFNKTLIDNILFDNPINSNIEGNEEITICI